MTKLFLALSLVIVSAAAHAETITVAFWPCSYNQNVACAQVYQSGAPQEMPFECSDEVYSEIVQRMNVAGHSLATNVEGDVIRINKLLGGQAYKLQIDSFSTSTEASRPRGL